MMSSTRSTRLALSLIPFLLASACLAHAKEPTGVVSYLQSVLNDTSSGREQTFVCTFEWGNLTLQIQKLDPTVTMENVHLLVQRYGRTVARVDAFGYPRLLSTYDRAMDINGDGRPDAVVCVDNGGSGAGMKVYVFDMSQSPKIIGNLSSTGDTRVGNFDAGPLGEIEILEHCPIFPHGGDAGGAGAQRHPVVLEFRHGRFSFAKHIMRKPEPAGDELADLEESFDHWDPDTTSRYEREWRYDQELLKLATDLIFSGNGDLAFRLVRRSFHNAAAQRDAFCVDFVATLRQNPWWRDVEALNEWTGKTSSQILQHRRSATK